MNTAGTGQQMPYVVGALPQPSVQMMMMNSNPMMGGNTGPSPSSGSPPGPRPKRKRDGASENNQKRLNKNEFEHVQWNYTQALEKCLMGASDMYFDDVEYDDLNP